MKVNVVIDSVSRAAGGLFDAERRLWQSLQETGVKVSAFSLADEFSARDANHWLPIVPECFPVVWPSALGRSGQLRARLLAEPADLLYRSGLWKWPSRYALEWSRQHDKPEIVATHGMLDPWAVKNSAWKKRLALLLYEREHLGRAACIRALCEAEARAIRAFGLKNPIAIIPNGIDLPAIPNAENPKVESKNEFQLSLAREMAPPISSGSVSAFAGGRKTLLYLGRIHPKKGLVNLIRAWDSNRKSQIGGPSSVVSGPSSEWTLAIAGWDQGGHEAELKRLCDELGIAWQDVRGQKSDFSVSAFQRFSVLFLGPQFGEDKATCYRNCDAFILPSFSEGLPMVILEAWAYGKPVLMTPECNLPEGFAANAAFRIETNVESIAQGLRELFETPSAERQALGDNGRRLVAEKFAWPKIAAEMRSVYEWVLGSGPKPGCVQTKC